MNTSISPHRFHPNFTSPPELLEHRIAPAIIYGVDAANNLYSFESEAPGTFTSTTAITGLLGTAGEAIVGIDFRPATGELYAFSVDTAQDGHLYVVNEFTGAASLVGSITAPALSPGVAYGFDFNPAVDRIRVVNAAGENLRLNPNNGALAGDDANLTFSPPATGPVTGIAYDRNFAGTAFTTVYGIDLGSDRLVTVGGINSVPTPNGGVVSAIGSLGVDAAAAHFDIETGTGNAFAALTVAGTLGLYTIDPSTGAATAVGNIGTGAQILTGMAVEPPRVTVLNSKAATYLDADGDRVTIKVTKGSLDVSDFRFIAAANGGGTLRLVDFSDDGAEFSGTNLTITVAKKRGGDGEAHVGALDAQGIDLGRVSIRGDLARLVAGDSDAAQVGLKSLQVNSMGRFGVATQGPVGVLGASITNGIGSAVIKGDLAVVIQLLTGANGTMDSLRVGGSLNGGVNGGAVGVVAIGDIGSISIRGDVIGGAVAFSGSISTPGNLGQITIGGDIIGGGGASSAYINAASIEGIRVGGDIVGGAGDVSAAIAISGAAGKILIKGGLYGGGGNISAIISAQSGDSVTVADGAVGGAGSQSGRLSASADFGRVTLGGNLVGGAGPGSGVLFAGADVDFLTIKGSVLGGVGEESGQVFIDGLTGKALVTKNVQGGSGAISGNLQLRGGLGSLVIGGSVIGGTANDTGVLFFPNGANNVVIKKDLIGGSISNALSLTSTGKIEGSRVGNLTIGGSVIAGSDGSTGMLLKSGGIFMNDDLGTLTVKGSLIGNEMNPVRIVTRGQDVPTTGVDLALGSLKVGRDVLYTLILAGYDAADFGPATADPTGFEAVNGNAQIGTITVGRHWMASNVAAGVRDLSGNGFGGADDQVINALSDSTLSSIAKVLIKGQFSGRGGGAETFGFVAQTIGALKIGSIAYGFDDTEGQVFALTSPTNDTFAREVIII